MKNIRITIIFVLVFLFLNIIPVMATSEYTVQKGDSLWAIALKKGISVDEIKQLNKLTSDLLSIGQKLNLTNNKLPQITDNIQPSLDTQLSSNLEDNIYIVQPGDNLWSIAANHRTTVNEIKSLNNLTTELLHPGHKLIIKGTSININVSRSGEITDGRRLISMAANYLGVPYKYAGSTPAGFDCSGFVQYVFKQVKVSLPRTAADQFKVGIAVDKQSLQSGDLVFFKRNGATSIDHVGIYTGNGNFIHASSPSSGGVIYSSVYDKGYYQKYYVGAKRVLN